MPPSELLAKALMLLLLIAAVCIPAIAAVGESTPLPGLGANWAFADFDGDHKPDLAELHPSSLNIQLSTGKQVRLSTRSAGIGPDVEMVILDVDGDNNPDIILRNRFVAGPMEVWLNKGDGSFAETCFAAILFQMNAHRGTSSIRKFRNWRFRSSH